MASGQQINMFAGVAPADDPDLELAIRLSIEAHRREQHQVPQVTLTQQLEKARQEEAHRLQQQLAEEKRGQLAEEARRHLEQQQRDDELQEAADLAAAIKYSQREMEVPPPPPYTEAYTLTRISDPLLSMFLFILIPFP